MKINPYLTTIILIFVLSTSSIEAASTISVKWGVQTGTSAKYFIDELTISSGGETTNYANILTIGNRTQLVDVTKITSNSVNYTIGLANGTVMYPSYSQFDKIPGTSTIIPSTYISLVLPIKSTIDGVDQNYLLEYANVAQQLKSFVDFSSLNLTEPSVFNIVGVYSTTMNITATIAYNDLNASIQDVLGMIDQLGFFNVSSILGNSNFPIDNSSIINGVGLNANIAYNRTDGMIQELRVTANVNSTLILESGNQTVTQDYGLKLSRMQFNNPVSTSPSSKTSSDTGKSPISLLPMIVTFVLVSYLTKKQKYRKN